MPTLDRITIYPVKSLDGLDVAEARVLPSGGLENDRRWQLTDLEGRVLNAKRTPLFHAIRAEYDLGGAGGLPSSPGNFIHLAIDHAAVAARAIPGIERLASLAAESFPLVPGPDGPCGWLAEVFGQPVLLVERADGGFPDDRDAPGPVVISTASLEVVAGWFRFDVNECRRRFRANLEIGDCEAFWEDAVASPARPELQPSLLDLPADLPADPYAELPPPEPRAFSIGDLRLQATNVCRRCVVPTRDSRTGRVTEQFREVFEAWRLKTMPAAVDASAWNHCHRLAINTRVDTSDWAKLVAVGDAVEAFPGR
jgi:uncharacterized protein YcbX